MDLVDASPTFAERIIKESKSAGKSTQATRSLYTASSSKPRLRVSDSYSPDQKQRGRQHDSRTPIQTKSFRLHSYDVAAGLKSNITKSFTPLDSKIYREICQLNEGLNRQQHRQLDKMLEKLCIKSGSRSRKHNWFGGVNVDNVQEMYVKEKSSQKQSITNNQLIRKDISRVSQTAAVTNLHSKQKKPSFFEYSSDRIKEFEKRHEPMIKQWQTISGGGKKKQRKVIMPHPIVALHNSQCQGLLQKYRSGRLALEDTAILDQYPDERVEQPDTQNQKLRRLRQLRCLRREISALPAKKEKIKGWLEIPFVENLS